MIRGTTPTIKFTLPFEYDLVEELWLTISQRSKELFTLKKDRMTNDGNTVSVKLTQVETLNMDPGPVQIQVRGRTADGTAFASRVKNKDAEETLKDGEI